MILQKLQSKNGFTESEKNIAEYILQHWEEIQELTGEELAKITLSSKSTVIRLCKKLGISGYQELKKLLYAETLQESSLLKSGEVPILNSESKYADYIYFLDRMYEKVIKGMQEQLNHNAVKRIINKLNKMERIDFYSSGLGYSIGEGTAHKYSTLGIESTAYSSINEVFLATAKNNYKTAVFVISLSGKNPSAIHNAQILKRYGIYVIGIVGALSKEIEHHCDEVVHILDGKIPPGTQHVSAVLSINYIFDLLFMGLLAKRYDMQIELYKKISFVQPYK